MPPIRKYRRWVGVLAGFEIGRRGGLLLWLTRTPAVVFP
jgi:hypothetical protein